jgi:hypothetical protein
MTYRHPKEKVDAAIKMLKDQGHTVQAQVRGEAGRFWFEVDSRMLVSWDEMQNLADGVYTLDELEELYRKRHDEEEGQGHAVGL